MNFMLSDFLKIYKKYDDIVWIKLFNLNKINFLISSQIFFRLS